jgi:integrase
VVFALETAARRGELLALRWIDVDLVHRTATLQVTKAGQPRRIPLSAAGVSMLDSLPRSLDGRVFPVSMEALKQAYEKAVARARIANFTFHDLRHNALTRLAKQGLSVLELRSISGHTTANMLQRYVSIDASELAIKLG